MYARHLRAMTVGITGTGGPAGAPGDDGAGRERGHLW